MPPKNSHETQPLLANPPPVYHSVQADVPQESQPPLNHFSTVDLYWVLGGLWSAVFLGALDGKSSGTVIPQVAEHSVHYRYNCCNTFDPNRKLFQQT